jgi:hypothetical protein
MPLPACPTARGNLPRIMHDQTSQPWRLEASSDIFNGLPGDVPPRPITATASARSARQHLPRSFLMGSHGPWRDHKAIPPTYSKFLAPDCVVRLPCHRTPAQGPPKRSLNRLNAAPCARILFRILWCHAPWRAYPGATPTAVSWVRQRRRTTYHCAPSAQDFRADRGLGADSKQL